MPELAGYTEVAQAGESRPETVNFYIFPYRGS